MDAVAIGVDVGQQRDPTALAVVHAFRDGATGSPPVHAVRHLERLPLGTPYPAVAARVAAVAAGAAAQAAALGAPVPVLYVDATGVGKPVVDEIARLGPRCLVVPVYFTHGDRRVAEAGRVALGKAYLVSRLQVLLQGKRLRLPRTAEAEALAGELLTYEIRVSEDANDRYGAFCVGSHDDLVTAVGLAVQADPAGVIVAAPPLLKVRISDAFLFDNETADR